MTLSTSDTLIAEAREHVAQLYVSYIDAKPQNYDFSERFDTNDHERWDFIEAVYCDDCDKYIVDPDDHGDDCPRQGEGYTEFDSAEGPMMNYRYPIDDDVYTNDNARKIADLPLCLVRDNDNDEVYLALTGGGMDLSWEICDAYLRLGYYPPSHFELPEMADKALNERNARIIAAVERSNEILAGWAQRRLERATNLFTSLAARTNRHDLETE